MLGHRGCRLGVTYPEITEMQARAIFEAAVNVGQRGVLVHPGGHDPARLHRGGVPAPAADRRPIAQQVARETGVTVKYLVGTMIELPRAALTAREIARRRSSSPSARTTSRRPRSA
jgi:pyruvate, orthophosphate dikinase